MQISFDSHLKTIVCNAHLGKVVLYIYCQYASSRTSQGKHCNYVVHVKMLLKVAISWSFILLLKLFQVHIIQPDNKRRSKVSSKDENDFQLIQNACSALWSCSRSPKNIQAIRAAGAVPILASLLVSGRNDVILPAMGIIQECAIEVRATQNQQYPFPNLLV